MSTFLYVFLNVVHEMSFRILSHSMHAYFHFWQGCLLVFTAKGFADFIFIKLYRLYSESAGADTACEVGGIITYSYIFISET
jgi:hypothetical protein